MKILELRWKSSFERLNLVLIAPLAVEFALPVSSQRYFEAFETLAGHQASGLNHPNQPQYALRHGDSYGNVDIPGI